MSIEYKNLCVKCGDHVLNARWRLGYIHCLRCGEEIAKQIEGRRMTTKMDNKST